MRSPLVAPGTAEVVLRRLTPEPERPLPVDPVEWVRDELNEHLWSKQRDVLRSVMRNRYTLVPSCHGPGKSFCAARLAAFWLAAHPVGEAFVVTSAPTEKQVKSILWRELARAKSKGGLAGRITKAAEWYMGPAGAEEIVGFGRKPQDLTSKEAAMQAFQGIHALYVLIVIDEATGVPGWLWDAADSLMTNENARLLAIGNPDDATSRFAEECKPGKPNTVIKISAFDCPAFTGERVPQHLEELLVSRLWVEERKEKWGEDSPLYQSKVLAEFPDTSDDKVVTPAMVRAAHQRELAGMGTGAFGLDVARFGADKSALYRVRDGVVRLVDTWGKADTVDTTDRTMGHVYGQQQRHVPVVVDADGIGAGVFDQLKRKGVKAIPFSLNIAAQQPLQFFNRRSEMWWQFRELMQDGLIDLDPEDEDLAAQLQQPKWWMMGARIRVESKDEMRKRGLPSPDRADAAIMATLGAPHERLRNGYASAIGTQQPQQPITAGLRDRRM